jgi:hypothetical protein
MKLDSGVLRFEIAEFPRRLLYSVLAEQALARGHCGSNGFDAVGLAYRHKRRGRCLSSGSRRDGGDSGPDGGKIGGDIRHGAISHPTSVCCQFRTE